MDTPIKVMIVDDHPMFRSGLRDALGSERKIKCVGECGVAAEVMDSVRHYDPDVVLMDIALAGKSGSRTIGIDLTRQIKAQWPEVEVIMLSATDTPTVVKESLKAGASGYLSKDADKAEIIGAIEQALNDGMPISPSINKSLYLDQHRPIQFDSFVSPPNNPPKYLIPVMHLLAEGLTNDEIWQRLRKERGEAYLERKTVRNYIYNISIWLGINGRREVIEQLRKMGYGKSF
ncbi:MAG: response regulator transcription factor [Anaerolineae bacterium]|nr:response regulator transcription factor [Anaerolineae bacterium]